MQSSTTTTSPLVNPSWADADDSDLPPIPSFLQQKATSPPPPPPAIAVESTAVVEKKPSAPKTPPPPPPAIAEESTAVVEKKSSAPKTPPPPPPAITVGSWKPSAPKTPPPPPPAIAVEPVAAATATATAAAAAPVPRRRGPCVPKPVLSQITGVKDLLDQASTYTDPETRNKLICRAVILLLAALTSPDKVEKHEPLIAFITDVIEQMAGQVDSANPLIALITDIRKMTRQGDPAKPVGRVHRAK